VNLGYDKPLYLLAFDHRGSFERDLFGASSPIPDKVRAGITDAKEVIYEGFVAATGRGVPREAAGVLVDEQYGASVARTARSAGDVLAMPVEKSGQAEFLFELLIPPTPGQLDRAGGEAVHEIADHYVETVNGFTGQRLDSPG
jgi:myo-inositol catabolism protein IolC